MFCALAGPDFTHLYFLKVPTDIKQHRLRLKTNDTKAQCCKAFFSAVIYKRL